MRQRANQRPVPAPLSQEGQVLADADARRGGVDRVELAADPFRGVGLQIEALVLRQSAGEEDKDDRAGFAWQGAALRRRTGSQGFERGQVVHPQTEQTDAAGLDRSAPRNAWMLKGVAGRRVRAHGDLDGQRGRGTVGRTNRQHTPRMREGASEFRRSTIFDLFLADLAQLGQQVFNLLVLFGGLQNDQRAVNDLHHALAPL